MTESAATEAVLRVLGASYDREVVGRHYRHMPWVIRCRLATGYTMSYGLPAAWPHPLRVVEDLLDAQLPLLTQVDLVAPNSSVTRRYRRDTLGEWEAV